MNIDTMRGRVRADLHDEDPANERWSDGELDRHIERAVAELSLSAPREMAVTLQTEAGSRDLDISSLSGRVSVDAVEYPSGEYPPCYVSFSLWGGTLSMLVDGAPGGVADVVVRYSAVHVLDATTSTLPQALEDVVATGAGAYAALEWASYATNRVNVGGRDVWAEYHGWAQERLAAFSAALEQHGRQRRLRARRLYLPAAGSLGGRAPGG